MGRPGSGRRLPTDRSHDRDTPMAQRRRRICLDQVKILSPAEDGCAPPRRGGTGHNSSEHEHQSISPPCRRKAGRSVRRTDPSSCRTRRGTDARAPGDPLAPLGVIVTMTVVCCAGSAGRRLERRATRVLISRPDPPAARWMIASRCRFGALADCPSTPIACSRRVDELDVRVEQLPDGGRGHRHCPRRRAGAARTGRSGPRSVIPDPRGQRGTRRGHRRGVAAARGRVHLRVAALPEEVDVDRLVRSGGHRERGHVRSARTSTGTRRPAAAAGTCCGR